MERYVCYIKLIWFSLMGLPEFEREKILADRQEKRDLLIERREVKRRLQRESHHRSVGKSSGRPSSSRKSGSGKSKLSELRRRREDREYGKSVSLFPSILAH